MTTRPKERPAARTASQGAVTRAPHIAVVLSGGIGLGAYQAGAYAALHERMRPTWFAGSSVGAINAAVIAGNPPEARVAQLRAFWNTDERSVLAIERGLPSDARHLQNWASVLQARLFGSPGHFHPRFMMSPFERFTSLYDLAPLRARLARLVDFGRLNGGEVRVAVAMTDIETGDAVVVDTGRGGQITMEHLLASCGFLPEFAPLDIDGRLLGDGGLAANAPVDAVLRDPGDGDLVCFVVDLFARDGRRPTSYEDASERKSDLMFGNQTWQRIEALQREYALCARIARLTEALPAGARRDAESAKLIAVGRRAADLFYLSYRAPRDEAGSEKPFDLSSSTMARRWHAGCRDMEEAVRIATDPRTRSTEPGLRLHRIRPLGSAERTQATSIR